MIEIKETDKIGYGPNRNGRAIAIIFSWLEGEKVKIHGEIYEFPHGYSKIKGLLKYV
jgi:hypothetical protein